MSSSTETTKPCGISLEDFVKQLDGLELPNLVYPYRHSDRALIKLFLYGLTRGMTGFKTLHTHLLERPDVLKLVGLDFPPSQDDAWQAL